MADNSKPLICSICKDYFIDPVTLKCKHSYCHGCIHQTNESLDELFTLPSLKEKIAKADQNNNNTNNSNSNSNQNDNTLPMNNQIARKCPECRAENQSFEKDLKLTDGVKKIMVERENKLKKILCDQCKKKGKEVPAKVNCPDCKPHNFCQECDQSIHSPNSVFEDHIRQNVDEVKEILICQEHKKKIKFICSNDSSLLCSTCRDVKKDQHKDHKINSLIDLEVLKLKEINEIIEKNKNNFLGIKNLIEKIEEMKNKVEENKTLSKRKIIELFEELETLIQNEKKFQLDQIDNLKNNKEWKLNQQKKVLIEMNKKIEEMDLRMKELNEKKNQNFQQLNQFKEKFEILEKSSLKLSKLPPCQNEEISIEFKGENELRQMICNLVEIKTKKNQSLLEIELDEKFDQNKKSANILISENNKVATRINNSSCDYVLGEIECLNGIFEWQIKIKKKSDYQVGYQWILIGIFPSSNLPKINNNSDVCEGTYGWTGHPNQVFINGKDNRGYQQYEMKEGDVIFLTLNCEKKKLFYKNQITGKEFSLDLIQNGSWRLHINLYTLNDSVEIISLKELK